MRGKARVLLGHMLARGVTCMRVLRLLGFLVALLLGATVEAAPPAQVAAALCDGPDALPLEVSGSRHFVNVELKGPKRTETLRFHVDSGGNTPGFMLQKSTFERLGFTDEKQLPK